MAEPKDTIMTGEEGWVSEESSFYGDDETKQRWEELATGSTATTRANTYCRLAPQLPAVLAANNSQNVSSNVPNSAADLTFYWPLAGVTTARQSTETPDEFVDRLPPSRSNVPEHGDWLWVHNPKAPPVDSKLNVEEFITAGTAILNEHLRKNGTSDGTNIDKQTMAKRDELARSLRDLAVEFGCLSGKWMLFPRNDSNVDGIWRTVVKAVVDNQLGTGAKIATASSNGSDKLICVYTKDFTDLGDVRRVLNALIKLKLVDSANSSGIWYKSDAYTHLGIQGKNPYGLRNSLYGSRDMLGQTSTSSRRR